MQGLVGKKLVSKTVIDNPYYEPCVQQALVVGNLKDQAYELFKKGGNTLELEVKIRLAKRRFYVIEKLFMEEHTKRVKAQVPALSDAEKEVHEL